jgi:uncharacterized membrane-anchored protein
VLTPIRIHDERCDRCGGAPACIPACPQQILTMGDRRIVMTHTDRCPEGCTVCVEACPPHVFSLMEEVHGGLGAVPAERVTGPAFVHHVAYLRDEDEDEKRVRDRFAALCDELKIPETQRSLGETRAHAWGPAPDGPEKLQLTWELHTEYYFIRAVLDGGPEPASPERMEPVSAAMHRAGRPPLLTSLEILVVDRPMDPDEVCERIVCRNRFGARVLGGDVAVYTNYEPFEGRERYVVAGTPEAVAEHGSFIVSNIGRIENYYHLLMIPRLEVRDTVQEVHRMEHAFSERMERLTAEIGEATPDRLRAWLGDLTLDLARLDRMQDEISDLVAILRTRVDMSMEAQNTQVLQNLDARSAIQLRLQQMAEGLSVIVISYYLTGLASYVFKALTHEGILASEILPTALFIPVAVFSAFLVTRKGAHLIRKKRTRPPSAD